MAVRLACWQTVYFRHPHSAAGVTLHAGLAALHARHLTLSNILVLPQAVTFCQEVTGKRPIKWPIATRSLDVIRCAKSTRYLRQLSLLPQKIRLTLEQAPAASSPGNECLHMT